MIQSMHEGAALAIGLHDEAQAVPPGKRRIEAQLFEEIERKFEPVGFLGIDVEADVVASSRGRQRLHARQELGHDAAACARL
jgi:hypothetical protein